MKSGGILAACATLCVASAADSQGVPTPGQGCLYGGSTEVSATRAQQNFVLTVPGGARALPLDADTLAEATLVGFYVAERARALWVHEAAWGRACAALEDVSNHYREK